MPGSLRNAVLGAVAATVVAGCGSEDGTIPQREADNLLNRLDAIHENVERGHCEDAEAQADAFATDVDGLSGEVEDEVRNGLEESANQLVSLTSTECEVESGATGPSGPVTTTEPSIETTETTPTTTEITTQEPADEPEQGEDQKPAEPPTGEPQADDEIAPPSGNEGQAGDNVGAGGGVTPSGGVSGGGGNEDSGGGGE